MPSHAFPLQAHDVGVEDLRRATRQGSGRGRADRPIRGGASGGVASGGVASGGEASGYSAGYGRQTRDRRGLAEAVGRRGLEHSGRRRRRNRRMDGTRVSAWGQDVNMK